LRQRLAPGGALVLGRHEALPAGTSGFKDLEPRSRIHCRANACPNEMSPARQLHEEPK
jgi:hypothetical protein